MSLVAEAIERRWREFFEYRTSPVDASMTIAARACSGGAPALPAPKAVAGAPASHAASTAANAVSRRLT